MRPEAEWLAIAAAAVLVAAGGAWLLGRHRRVHAHASPRAPTALHTLVVTRAAGPIVDDGEFEEPSWPKATLGGAFVDTTGGEARPHSELRFTWDPTGLHVALYAADGDIEPTDAFAFHVGREGEAPLDLAVSPRSVVEPSGARRTLLAGHDVDGTVGDPRDDDEEWVTELTVPWSMLGAAGKSGERFVVAAERCDDPKDGGGHRCAAMRATTLVLE